MRSVPLLCSMTSNKTKNSKASISKSASSNETSTKATSGTNQTDHQPFARDHDQTPFRQASEPFRDTLLRGIGHWTGSPDRRSGRTADSGNGGEVLRRCGSGEQRTNPSSEGGRNQGLTAMERFRAERRRDEPFGYLDRSSGGVQRAQKE